MKNYLNLNLKRRLVVNSKWFGWDRALRKGLSHGMLSVGFLVQRFKEIIFFYIY